MLNRLLRCLTKNKHRLRICLCAAASAMILAGLMICLQPMFVTLFCRTNVSSGIDIYTEERYLEYDMGTIFQETVSTCGFVEQCDLLSFSYFDNSPRDTILYGKQSDFFVLELNASTHFSTIQKKIFNMAQYAGDFDDYSLYYIDAAKDNRQYCVIFGLCEDLGIIRVMLATDLQVVELPYRGSLARVLFSQTTLKWENDI